MANVLLDSAGQPKVTRLLTDYKGAQGKAGLAPATINSRVSAVRSLLKLGMELGYISWAVKVKNIKSEPYRDTKGPGAAAVSKMIAAIGKRPDKPKPAKKK